MLTIFIIITLMYIWFETPLVDRNRQQHKKITAAHDQWLSTHIDYEDSFLAINSKGELVQEFLHPL